ncbi:hypothetical protein W97_07191 [Coniosporium apollinis CBS 100218]|uniref:NADH-ubiquinone reductase complex 1 MLRQ subunit n=1 Tax=Coniosporium apollinis (strain CBS 100218) TaxID=1168221 RepID=R7Z1S1_CONA1|nr:uncharacterized protein W97_07191 [Coniosporium apollinis CBS 100218]EON68043.1 hypothetical protein W97_07191 [Coniosporium apollinis CBS 100218]
MAAPLSAMYRARILNMQPLLRSRFQPVRSLHMKPTARMMRPVPKEEHSAHTISQRIRTLKKIPPELIPLGVVLAIAVGMAAFSIVRKLYADKTLRLSRTRGHNQGEDHP